MMNDTHQRTKERGELVPYPQHAKCKAELEEWRIDTERRIYTSGAGKALAPGTDTTPTAALDDKTDKACSIAYGVVLKTLTS